MFSTNRHIAAGCFVLGLILLFNPQRANARRPSTVASKIYPSGKFLGKRMVNVLELETGKTGEPSDSASTPASNNACHRTVRVRAVKPLHVSLPHATKLLPKFTVVQNAK